MTLGWLTSPEGRGTAAAARAGPGPSAVLICENDPVMRSALSDLLASVPEIRVVGVAGDAEDAAEAAAHLNPDVAVVDVRMPKGGGPRAARLIRECCPDVRLVAFSAYADSAVVIAMLRAGVSDYLVKGVDDDKLIEACRRSERGVIGLTRFELSDLVFELVELLSEAEQRLARLAPGSIGPAVTV